MNEDKYQETLHYVSCWNCGCKTYTFYLPEIEIGVYKVKCNDCGKLIEGERAEEMLKDCSVISDKDKELYKKTFGEIINQMTIEFHKRFYDFCGHYGLNTSMILRIIDEKIPGIQRGNLSNFQSDLLKGLSSAKNKISYKDYLSHLECIIRPDYSDKERYDMLYNLLKELDDNSAEWDEYALDEDCKIKNISLLRKFSNYYVQWIKKWQEAYPYVLGMDQGPRNKKFCAELSDMINSAKEEYCLTENDIEFFSASENELQEESEPQLEIPPANIRVFVPRLQLMVMLESEEYKTDIERLNKEIENIPKEYPRPTDEEIKNKGSLYDALTVHAHFFNSKIDWYVLSWDRENDIIENYMIGEAECWVSSQGSAYLSDLTKSKFVKLDINWEKRSLAQVLYEKYPEDFPKPKQ